MAQGTIKPKAASTSKKTFHSVKQKQKNSGHKIAKPKNLKNARGREMARKGAAGLTSNLEKQLAERAGHTEIIAVKEGKKRATMGAEKNKLGTKAGSKTKA